MSRHIYWGVFTSSGLFKGAVFPTYKLAKWFAEQEIPGLQPKIKKVLIKELTR